MTHVPPKGFRPLLEIVQQQGGPEALSLLCLGRLKAFVFDPQSGVIDPIQPLKWTYPLADRWISSGRYTTKEHPAPWHPPEPDKLILILENEAPAEEVRINNAPKPHRPKGTGKQRTDEVLIERMHKLISDKQASSATNAVRRIIKEDGETHGAFEDSTVRRLT
jgi:hypothetical protein